MFRPSSLLNNISPRQGLLGGSLGSSPKCRASHSLFASYSTGKDTSDTGLFSGAILCWRLFQGRSALPQAGRDAASRYLHAGTIPHSINSASLLHRSSWQQVLTGVGGEGCCPNEHPTAWGIQRLWRGWVGRTKRGWRQLLLTEIPKVEWDESLETWPWRHCMECCMK